MNHIFPPLKKNCEQLLLSPGLLPKVMHPSLRLFLEFSDGVQALAGATREPPARKRQALDAIEAGFSRPQDAPLPAWAVGFAQIAKLHPALMSVGRDVIAAGLQASLGLRFATYEQWLAYARRRTAPMGRLVLYMSGEKHMEYASSDALCQAVQLLYHVQDAASDYATHDRVMLPTAWWQEAGAKPSQLTEAASPLALRRVFHRALSQAEQLLGRAATLPGALHHWRTRMEMRHRVAYGYAMLRALRARDPLVGEATLSTVAYARAFIGWH